MTRSPHEIGGEILMAMHEALMKSPGKVPTWVRTSMPYAKALRRMHNWKDDYGLEPAKGVVLYLLNNLHNWRGDAARSIKAELHEIVKEK